MGSNNRMKTLFSESGGHETDNNFPARRQAQTVATCITTTWQGDTQNNKGLVVP